MRSVLTAFATLVLSLSLTGCCSWAIFLCEIEPPPSPPPYTRDTPHGAVDFLADAFGNRRIADIFESLHPAFIEQMGGFTASEFAAAYEEFEDLFEEDARSFASARRSEVVTQGQVAHMRLDWDGGHVVLAFRNVPAYTVHLDDEDLPEIPGTLSSMEETVEVQGAELVITKRLSLQGLGGIPEHLITRVELHDDWLLLDFADAQGVKFLERLEEELADRRENGQ